jgi:2',5'-phosphodiesterase
MSYFLFSGGKPEIFERCHLSHDLKLHSACGYPEYTNYVTSFNGCLDYIFIEQESFDVCQVVPLQSHDEVTQFTALPNKVFPSDHLALVCDLKLKSK